MMFHHLTNSIHLEEGQSKIAPEVLIVIRIMEIGWIGYIIVGRLIMLQDVELNSDTCALDLFAEEMEMEVHIVLEGRNEKLLLKREKQNQG